MAEVRLFYNDGTTVLWALSYHRSYVPLNPKTKPPTIKEEGIIMTSAQLQELKTALDSVHWSEGRPG